ncbi:hypothetical protein H8E77_35795 [bacterium]|nr:hypothetical protein [bacterium]
MNLFEDNHFPHSFKIPGLNLAEVDAASSFLAQVISAIPIGGFVFGEVLTYFMMT